MIYQLQYRSKTKLTAKAIKEAREAWVLDFPTPGVEVVPVSWSRLSGDVKEASVSGYIGRAGLVKCYAKPNWTMCDYDTAKAPSLESVWRLSKMLDIKPLWVRLDRTRRGWHLIIEWGRRFRPIEIVAIQAVLGSDRAREAFNLARVFSGKARNRRWNLLFHGKLTCDKH